MMIQTTKYGIETKNNMTYNLFPNEYKAIIQLVDVKANIKTYVPENSL